jgi:hypothetical protein
VTSSTPRVPCWDGKTQMAWVRHDGGRADTGRKGKAGDCVTRAIAIATGQPYEAVYAALKEAALLERPRKGRKRSSVANGVKIPTIRRFMASLGWTWVPTMKIGAGTTVSLCEEDLPMGTLIVSVSKHLTCVIDRVIHDTGNPSRGTIVHENGKPERIARRCVYGYWIKPS